MINLININMINDDFNIDKYSDNELFNLMDLNNPSDRELEARIIMLMNQYESETDVYRFFEDVFDRFFSHNEDIIEGFTTPSTAPTQPTAPTKPTAPQTQLPLKNIVVVKNDDSTENKDPVIEKYVNPMLAEPVKRVICIDSQYRDNLIYPFSSNFTFNLSETLTDVISVKLYSLQIPFTWYTVGNEYGSNFFYLKGISPGINNGNFDYKIQIDPGNYKQIDFSNSINTSFQNIFNSHLDVSFGVTSVSYNSINSKLKTSIDIKSIYNETNYFLDFTNGIVSNDPNHVSSIRQLFGFNDYNYFPCSVYSNYVNYTSIDSLSNSYKITKDNNTIYISLYQSSLDQYSRVLEYQPSNISNNNFSIVSSLILDNYYTPLQIFNDINQQIINSPFLNKNSSLSFINKRYELKLALNRNKDTTKENMKYYVSFSGDLWSGANSLFNFNNLQNNIIEMNNIISEKRSSETRTSFVINYNLSISFISNNFNYKDGPTFNVQNSTDILDTVTYINKINSALIGNNDMNSTYKAELNLSSNNYITINCQAKKTIYVSDISIINNLENFSIENASSNVIIQYTNFGYIVNEGAIFTITLRNNNFTKNIILNIPILQNTFTSHNDFIDYIIKTITSYNSINYREIDLSQSTLSIITIDKTGKINCKFNIVVIIRLIESNYTMKLNSGNDIWKTDFGLNSSYDLSVGSDYSITTLPVVTGKQVQGNMIFYTNLLYLTGLNNFFLIRPIPNILGGVYTTDEIYMKKMKLDLPLNIFYTKEQVALSINNLFNNDKETKGSYVELDNLSYTKIRLNINKLFTSLDYKIVFFDGAFTKCNYGNSHSIGNVKWDTTLGWILGFRNLTEYNLTADNLSTDGITTYYNVYFNQSYTINNNIVTLTGDTAINVNLYNYLLINIDDFCQNRINDGLVTITKTENNIPLPSYANRNIYRCDPSTIKNYPSTNQRNLAINRVDNNNLTAKQVYSATQILNIKQVNFNINKLYSAGPNSQDIFGIIPIKTGGLNPGDSFIDFSGGLQNQERKYVGPVNLRRMSIQLLNDKGHILDLNGANWSFSLIIEQIYNPSK